MSMNSRQIGQQTRGPEVTAQEKHLELNEAINGIDFILDSLGDLRKSISGPEPEQYKAGPDLEEPKEMRPSLSDVLNEAPSHIRRKIEEALKRIEHIRSLLF